MTLIDFFDENKTNIKGVGRRPIPNQTTLIVRSLLYVALSLHRSSAK